MLFAARWCAKEALVKCDPAYKGQPFSTLEVVRNELAKSHWHTMQMELRRSHRWQ